MSLTYDKALCFCAKLSTVEIWQGPNLIRV